LAIYALPHAPGSGDAALDVKGEAIAKAFEAGLPNARVVRLPKANHFVFLSNQADVLREMEAFLGTLK
jgi:pimeloyl-ACP methyl ester carboxylesterase